MAQTLTVWKFHDPDAAERVRDEVMALQKKELIKVHDAAVVTWPEGVKHPRTKQLVDPTSAGAASGAFWGLLFGLIFFVPFFGAIFGTAVGALSGSLRDFGIDDDFIESIRDQVTEGTSALFLLSSDAVVDRVRAELSAEDMELLTTNLSVEDEEALRETFSGD